MYWVNVCKYTAGMLKLLIYEGKLSNYYALYVLQTLIVHVA